MKSATGSPAATIPEAIASWAARRPETLAAASFERGEAQTDALTFVQLDLRARNIAARLVAKGQAGRPVLLVARSDLRFVEAFCGCLYAGVISVPTPPPAPGRRLARFVGIARDCEARVAIGGAPDFVREAVPWLEWLELADIRGGAPIDGPIGTAGDLAMLQYTSGTTDRPKGVVLTHRNLFANMDMVASAFGVDATSRVFSWLPLFHDLGLLALILSLRCGIPFGVMPPMIFLQRPERWLASVDRFRATISGGPNFAYDFCRQLPPETLGALDLGCWKTAFCGAERIRSQTIEGFADKFASAGFRRETFFPGYGLAEATVFVAGSYLSQVRGTEQALGCGLPAPGTSVRIVDPETLNELPERSVGEVWVSGDHVGIGYKSVDSRSTFQCALASDPGRTYLRTGDLGFLDGGRLHIQGRIKETIIHRGANMDPVDIEATILESHWLFERTGAAFSILVEGTEQVVVVHEVSRAFGERNAGALIEAALAAVAESFGLRLHDLVLVRAGTIEKTTSGKIMRGAARSRYEAGGFERLGGLHRSLGRSQPSSMLANASDETDHV